MYATIKFYSIEKAKPNSDCWFQECSLVVILTGVHRTMATAKVRSLRMDSKVWTQSLIQVFTIARFGHVLAKSSGVKDARKIAAAF